MDSHDPILDSLLCGLPRDSAGLLHALIPRIDQSMVDEIAASDYGMDREAHEQAIQEILRSGAVKSMQWEPGEVLQLCSYSLPANEREHIMRAFCACCLLHAPDFCVGGENDNVARAIASAFALGDDIATLARDQIVSRLVERMPEREERLFFVLGLLLLQARLAPNERAWFDRAVYWIELEDAAMRQDSLPPIDERFVWGLSHQSKQDIWLPLLHESLLGADQSSPSLRAFGQRLVTAHDMKRRTRRKGPA